MPILFRDMLYIHMPKTGGIWVSKTLRGEGGTKIPGCQRHATTKELPADCNKYTLFGTIRDPWSWYVSFWNHLGSGVDGPPLREALTFGDRTFEAYLYCMTHAKHWSNIPSELRAGWPWPAPGLHEGFYSAMVGHCYGNPLQVSYLLDTMQLNVGLASLTGQKGPFTTPPQNTGAIRPGTIKIHWTDKMIQLVQQTDGTTASAFGYTDPNAIVPAVIRIKQQPE